MKTNVWRNTTKTPLSRTSAVRLFTLLVVYLLFSYNAFSTTPFRTTDNNQSYAIPVDNGGYQITFIFSKTSEMRSGGISVEVENNQIINSLDGHAFSGGEHSFSVERTVTVNDGVLNIEYSSPVAKLAFFLKKTEASASPTYNDPPVVQLIQPSDAAYVAGDDITLVAEVSDSDGRITKTSFWVDGKQVDEQSVSIEQGFVTYTWPSVPAGTYQIQARAQDDEGEITTSSAISYEVTTEDNASPSPGAPGSPTPPTADIGEPGVYYSYYVGEWPALPNFDQLTPTSQGTLSNFTFDPAIGKLYTMGFVYEAYLLIEQAGEYTFYVNANDGSNFYLDGREIINNDGRRAEAQEKSGSVQLSAGYHPIRLTFFERWGPQVLEVRYQGPGVSLQAIPDDKLFLQAPTEAPIPNLPPVVDAGNDIEITLPQAEISLEATATDEDGTIASYQWSKIGGEAVIVQPNAATTSVTGLQEGVYQFVIAVQDDAEAISTDTVSVVVNAAPIVDDPIVEDKEPRLNYAYYEGQWRTLPDFSQLSAVEVGTTSNFSLSERKKDEFFGFAFTGYIDIQTAGTYQFYTASDDGSVLYIDGQKIVDNDGRHAKQERSGSVDLTKGKHPIRVEFFEHRGRAILEVSYAGPSINKMLIPDEVLSLEGDPVVENPQPPVADIGEPGVYYSYYVGEWPALPNFDQLTPTSQGTLSNFTFDPAIGKLYTMGFVYEAYLLIEQAGEYTFYVNANDGSNFYLDGREIINNDGRRAEAQEKSGSVQLSAGYHPIRLTFFERWGPQVLEVRYQGPGVSLQAIPDDKLFLQAPKTESVKKGEKIHVNFHRAGRDVADNWNNIHRSTNAALLKNIDGTSSAITLKLETAWDGDNRKGYATENNSGKYPDAVTRSYFWTQGQEVITLNGASPDKVYSFTFFASSMFGGNRNATYRIGNQEVTLNASYNEEETVTISNVRPAANGQIQIDVSRVAGATYGFIGALVIESTGAPTPVARQESTPKKGASLTSQIEEPQLLVAQPEINIYPNPSIGIIHIKTEYPGNYWISDIQGNTFKTGTLNKQKAQSLNLTDLPKGVYLVRTQTNNHWNTQKIVIQ
ncbi:PA14 domain-containing protein [Tunicatimonas pelagia]|uniref:PA14 domain-containing protein n=1 Tax=Tunicatimonas pelagia TaxID=931531 RepID=UPI00266588B8|nr:PA14 domain-containing protein [Tunicatimonas pelagia]WKN40994.1 PA14 domain-containing protein [Tunicatimonas pelagia]